MQRAYRTSLQQFDKIYFLRNLFYSIFSKDRSIMILKKIYCSLKEMLKYVLFITICVKRPWLRASLRDGSAMTLRYAPLGSPTCYSCECQITVWYGPGNSIGYVTWKYFWDLRCIHTFVCVEVTIIYLSITILKMYFKISITTKWPRYVSNIDIIINTSASSRPLLETYPHTKIDICEENYTIRNYIIIIIQG